MSSGGKLRAGHLDGLVQPLWGHWLLQYQIIHPLAALDITLLFLSFFSISCNFFYIHCNNSRYSKDFLCVCFSRAKVTTKHSFQQSLAVLAQLQAADCEMSYVLSLAPLIVKKSEHIWIECRAAATLSKDSRRLFGVFHSSPCEMVSALGYFSFSVFCLCMSILWRLFTTRRGEKISTVRVLPVLSALPPVYLL